MKRLGIIGWGYWGRNYARYFNKSLDARLEWVCDTSAEMRHDAQSLHPHVHTLQTVDELIDQKPDGVIIAVPARMHFEIASKLAHHHIPVLIEKPLTHDLASAFKLQHIMHANKTVALIGHTFLYNQSVRWIKKHLEKKYFGSLYSIEFKRQSYGPIRDDVNVVWDFASHDISIISWLLEKQEPLTVSATAKSYSRNCQDDIAFITLEYPNNILVSISVAWLYPLKVRNMTMLGSKKMAVFDDTNAIEPLRIYEASVTYPSAQDPYGASFLLGDVHIPRLPSIDPLQEELRHFVACIKHEEKPLTSIDSGVTNVMILTAITKAIQMGDKLEYQKWKKQYKNVA